MSAHGLPNDTFTQGSVIVSGDSIRRLDSSSGCLPSAVADLSGENRVVLDSLAKELKSSPFRDFHQFAPAALALGSPRIEEKILGNDYASTIAGLRELKDLFTSRIPSIATAEADSKGQCDAPTAQNLQAIYTELHRLLWQFA
ncbi:hypothetical protein EDC05_001573 [Coemansia umbellata]|nr:hypothetical protein EDC05_001573 [Coemansia umbellata]